MTPEQYEDLDIENLGTVEKMAIALHGPKKFKEMMSRIKREVEQEIAEKKSKKKRKESVEGLYE